MRVILVLITDPLSLSYNLFYSLPFSPLTSFPIYSQRRQLKARAEAKLSLEETENSSILSSGCSTISNGSPRYGSPLDTNDRNRQSSSPQGESRNKYKSNSGMGSDRNRNKYKDRADEGEGKRSDFYPVDAKETHGQVPDAKNIPKNVDAKNIQKNVDAKTFHDSPHCKIESKTCATGSIAERRGIGIGGLDSIRTGAALMTAGGSGLLARVAIDGRYLSATSEVEEEGAAKASLLEEDPISSLTREIANAMVDINSASSAVFLYVPPCPSPLVAAAPVSAFSSRLLGHQISADPEREAER